MLCWREPKLTGPPPITPRTTCERGAFDLGQVEERVEEGRSVCVYVYVCVCRKAILRAPFFRLAGEAL